MSHSIIKTPTLRIALLRNHSGSFVGSRCSPECQCEVPLEQFASDCRETEAVTERKLHVAAAKRGKNHEVQITIAFDWLIHDWSWDTV